MPQKHSNYTDLRWSISDFNEIRLEEANDFNMMYIFFCTIYIYKYIL